MVKIQIEAETLTDGSVVWNVRLGDTVLHAYGERQARKLASMFVNAIHGQTTDAAEIRGYVARANAALALEKDDRGVRFLAMLETA